MKLKSNLTIREIAGEKILVINGASGVDLTKVVMFNSTAEFLWNSLQEKDFQNECVEELLVGKYGITKEQAKIDAGAWLKSLIDACLVE